ncbi:MAG: hypothetical protein Q9209_005820 [Squamulea sp. 1 TL-2023]
MHRGHGLSMPPLHMVMMTAARTPGHPMERISWQLGIPPEEMGAFLEEDKVLCDYQGVPCKFEPLVCATMAEAKEGRLGRHGDGRHMGDEGLGRHERYYDGYDEAVYEHHPQRGKGRPPARRRRHDDDDGGDTFGEEATARPRKGHHGRGKGRPQPSETTESEKDPREARRIAKQQKQARAERRNDAYELSAELQMQHQMKKEQEHIARQRMGGWGMGGMGGMGKW